MIVAPRAGFWGRALARLRLLRPPRRFPPTREGWWFIAGTLLVGAAAINSGFNLLFLVWGMMLCLIVASGVLSELCLRRVRVTRQVPTGLHAGAPYLMGLEARNDKRWLPSFSVEVEDLVAERPVERRCYFLKIPAGRQQRTAYRHTVERRGVYRLQGFRISTKFPFGLIRKSLDVEAPADVLVYPTLVPVPVDLPLGVGLGREGARESRRSRRGEFLGLREFRQGDDPRDIHWRTAARRGKAFVREHEDDTARTVMVLLDNAAPSSIGDAAFEGAVSMAASIAVHLLRRGLAVGLAARGLAVAPEAGQMQEHRILRALALIQRADDAALLPDVLDMGPSVLVRPGPERPIVRVAHSAAEIPAA